MSPSTVATVAPEAVLTAETVNPPIAAAHPTRLSSFCSTLLEE